MIQDKDTRVIPRSIRCTRAEHIYLSALLKQLRMNGFDFNAQAKPEQSQKFEGALIIDDLPKDRIGITPNDFLRSIGKEPIIEDKSDVDLDNKEKDYSAWRNDKLMNDIFDSCLWEPTGENQCYPEGVEKYQVKYKDLWIKLNNAKRNNQSAICDEIMTEMMERIYNER